MPAADARISYAWHSRQVNQLLNKLLGFEVSTKVEDLPGGEAEETAHGEDGEIEHTWVCRFYASQTGTHNVWHDARVCTQSWQNADYNTLGY